jgi:heptaprenyl diphosphate synthase
VVADDEQLGKPSGHDLAEGTYNLPVLRALAADDAVAAELRPLLGSPIEGAALATARDLVRSSVGVDQSVAVARSYVDQAVAALAPFGERPTSTALAGAAHHLLVELDAIRSA